MAVDGTPHENCWFDVQAGVRTYRHYLPAADSDAIQKHLSAEGVPYEWELVSDVIERTAAGDLIVDAGANIGNHTLAWAVNGRRVRAFEPSPDLCGALRATVEANGLTDAVEVVQAALSDTPGELTYVLDDEANLGGAHVEAVGEADGTRVPAVVLEPPETKVAAIKIDVEGFELPVLRGARALLTRDHPLVYIECLDFDHYCAVSEFLTDVGYAYCATFNASPTHRFEWREVAPVQAEVVAVRAAMERMYVEHEAHLKVRTTAQGYRHRYELLTGQAQGRGALRPWMDDDMIQMRAALLKEAQDVLKTRLRIRDLRFAEPSSEAVATSLYSGAAQEREFLRRALVAALEKLGSSADETSSREDMTDEEWLSVEASHLLLVAHQDLLIQVNEDLIQTRQERNELRREVEKISEEVAMSSRQAAQRLTDVLELRKWVSVSELRMEELEQSAARSEQAASQALSARNEAQAVQKRMSVELEKKRQEAFVARQELFALRGSTAYRAGRAVSMTKTPRAVVTLPLRLARIWVGAQRRKQNKGQQRG